MKTPNCAVGRELLRDEDDWTSPCPRGTAHLIIVEMEDAGPLKQKSLALCCHHYHQIPDDLFEERDFDPSLN